MQEKLHKLHYYRWILFSVVALGTFVSTLTSSIVNVALPMITLSLKSDITTAQWVVTAYLLIITSLLPLLGRLGVVFFAVQYIILHDHADFFTAGAGRRGGGAYVQFHGHCHQKFSR